MQQVTELVDSHGLMDELLEHFLKESCFILFHAGHVEDAAGIGEMITQIRNGQSTTISHPVLQPKPMPRQTVVDRPKRRVLIAFPALACPAVASVSSYPGQGSSHGLDSSRSAADKPFVAPVWPKIFRTVTKRKPSPLEKGISVSPSATANFLNVTPLDQVGSFSSQPARVTDTDSALRAPEDSIEVENQANILSVVTEVGGNQLAAATATIDQLDNPNIVSETSTTSMTDIKEPAAKKPKSDNKYL